MLKFYKIYLFQVDLEQGGVKIATYAVKTGKEEAVSLQVIILTIIQTKFKYYQHIRLIKALI